MVNINSVKISGSIYKADLGTIYLRSAILKYSENSKIYIDFPNNGISKNIILPSSYTVTSEDINSISLIDINSGTLELSSNNIIFTPKILNIKFNTKNSTNLKSSLLNTFLTEEQYYYGQSLILSQSFFPVNDNEFVIKIYDKEGNNYNLGETIILKKDKRYRIYV